MMEFEKSRSIPSGVARRFCVSSVAAKKAFGLTIKTECPSTTLLYGATTAAARIVAA
jgi:hypothetical protein